MGAAACGDDPEGGPKGELQKLTVWGPDAQQDTLKEMANKFKEANPDLNLEISVGVCSESNAYGEVGKDPSAAADVYAYANDQLANLVRVGALAEIRSTYKDKVVAENTASTVDLGTFEGKLYGYPYAADNGYFMYYDNTVVSEEQAKTLEGLIQACKDGGKKIAWTIGDGWYDVAWFFAFGGEYSVTYNEDLTEKEVRTNFATEVGTKATKAIRKLVDSGVYVGAGVNTDDVKAQMGDDIAVAITGSWNADTFQDKLGDNLSATKLPTVTVDGETKQIGSFVGGKLFGVNPHTKNLTTAHKLAQLLTGEEMQALRFEKHQTGPSNIKVAESDEVKNNLIVKAFAEQAAHGTAQTSVPANFWDPMKAYALWAAGEEYTADGVQAKLDETMSQIVPKTAFSFPYLVGTINGWNNKEAPRVEAQKFKPTDDANIWTLEYTFEKPSEVKVVKVDTVDNAEWSADDNLVIDKAGIYTLTYDLDADKLTAELKEEIEGIALDFCYLVGTINGWKADENPRVEAQKFTSTDGNIWTLEYTLAVNDEIKVVKVDTKGGADWSGADNLKIEEAGTYTLTYNLGEDTLTAEKKA
ncbi:MAG: extracellular solute-binding protein [Clostridiales bacterium]|nr:extracellular solute-binding protein [Clostridiales bacterium]